MNVCILNEERSNERQKKQQQNKAERKKSPKIETDRYGHRLQFPHVLHYTKVLFWFQSQCIHDIDTIAIDAFQIKHFVNSKRDFLFY